MIFQSNFINSEKSFFQNSFKNPSGKSLDAPGAVHPHSLARGTLESTGPTYQPEQSGVALTSGFLAAGEVSGDGEGTNVLPAPRRTQCTNSEQRRSSEGGSPVEMAARRCWSSSAGQCRPRERPRKRARAPRGEGEADAQDRRRRKGVGSSGHARRPTAAMAAVEERSGQLALT
jgi:hypothetical protein